MQGSTSCVSVASGSAGKTTSCAGSQETSPIPSANIRCRAGTARPVDGPLLVSGEQGLGDQVLFASMLPDVAARTPRSPSRSTPRLIPLFARSFPQVNIVAREEAAALSRPRGRANSDRRVSGGISAPIGHRFPVRSNGYLRCDEEVSARLRERLSDGRKVIGLS